MKANGAPEKLYLLQNGFVSYCRNTDEDVEYCCTNAFIEKLCQWLEENVERHISADGEYTVYYEEMFEDIRNYMEGE